jgi:hypothetical protein
MSAPAEIPVQNKENPVTANVKAKVELTPEQKALQEKQAKAIWLVSTYVLPGGGRVNAFQHVPRSGEEKLDSTFKGQATMVVDLPIPGGKTHRKPVPFDFDIPAKTIHEAAEKWDNAFKTGSAQFEKQLREQIARQQLLQNAAAAGVAGTKIVVP